MTEDPTTQIEMPEGWKSLKDIIENTLIEAHRKEDDPKAKLLTAVVANTWLTPLNLMKEMAEALEQAVSLIESEWGPISEDVRSGERDLGGSKPFVALKKFKEWN